MIQAVARVLKNVIEVQVGTETWTARPVVTATGALTKRIAALFSTVYEVVRPAEPDAVHATVSYHPKKDEILIQIGEQKWHTRSSLFGPTTFEYGGISYTIVEKLTGKFAILRGEALIAQGEVGFRRCMLREYPPEFEVFLTNLCLGYLVRVLFWAQ
ncbi:MAG TPA: hypothetical protein VGV89_04660 [Thermoplasmata archaeon]|nr:hypothetical protein [Thermoplasmata archaeon]